ncbi:DUF2231 domain-containing protein [Rhizobium wenxiniae]|uniref:DUF2231 domain-containing protein n=1 Tax=Rhizobium wenxiniae TaxID=1737357 RepID=UPI001C6E5BBF|nr:DUF2231 domain-containing protein [Rhizobium wenxiniae]MBW9089513.1 DUF2231 domain-containing protein [Rhizobium wenxiniae]
MAALSSPNRDSAAYPLQSLFVPFPLVCFTLTLVADISYWQSGGNLIWLTFASWLLFAGLVFGAIGLLAGVIDILRRRTRPLRPGFMAILLYIAILLLAFVNSFVHARDGWTAVVPFGLAISTATFVLIVFASITSARKYARLAWRV